jgi:hypothetical protein
MTSGRYRRLGEVQFGGSLFIGLTETVALVPQKGASAAFRS